MDDSVLAAIRRWPDVPAVYGWLSLDARGTWRLHAEGASAAGGLGDSITSLQIIAFINRNYESDAQGQWFFQNGPQRVYVRLDAAPYVLRLAGDGNGLETHTGLAVQAISQWLLDDEGRLFAITEHGGAIVDGRDLEAILGRLTTLEGAVVIDLLEKPDTAMDAVTIDGHSSGLTPFAHVAKPELPNRLNFVENPENKASNPLD